MATTFSYPQNFTDVDDVTRGAFDPMRSYLQRIQQNRTPAENRMYQTNNLLAPVRANAYPTVFAQNEQDFGQGMANTANQASDFWQQLLRSAGGDANKAIEAARPYLQQIGGLAEAIGSYYGNKELQANLEAASGQADPFGSQRAGYQERLQNTFTNPDWMSQDPTLNPLTDDQYIRDYANKDFSELYPDQFIQDYGNTDVLGKLGDENYLQSISDRIQNDVAKEMSAKGFMNSGNYGMELGTRLQQEIAPLSLQQQQYISQAKQAQAGNLANLNQSRFGTLAGLGANQAGNVANLQQQRVGDLVRSGQAQQNYLGNLSGAQFGPGQAAGLSQAAAEAGYRARTGGSAGLGYSLQQQPNYPQSSAPQWRSLGATSRPTGFGGIEYGP